jgi:hypothetical protein
VDHAPLPDDPAAPPRGEPAAPLPGDPAAPLPGDPVALRAEHDALAERLATRLSVDRMKEGGVLTFFTVIAFGMTAKLGWDRWGWLPVHQPKPAGQYPLWFLLGVLITLVLLSYAVRQFRRASALRRQEAALFERFRALRARLELDT